MSDEKSYCCPRCGVQAIECVDIATTEGFAARQPLPFSLSFDCPGRYWTGCGAALLVTWRDAGSAPLVQSHDPIEEADVAEFEEWEASSFARIEALDDLFGALPDGVVVATEFVERGAAR